ncbi:MAG: phosphoribosylformylglycinamidine cyclo-ligase [Omnitrophica WOR_2 bacterium GWA2_47_8]|nr:MAG: phosphoribosylformylglycinamidine cyclo-ligase [Omnitrophica WOR_2 bacterium GWA2_47_8]
MTRSITYKTAGVDIDKANVFVEGIKRLAKGTMDKNVILRKGSFGSLYGLDKKYKDPVLVSSTDGVGTKLLVAKLAGKHDTIGIDLVAMNVNDVLCAGAKPLFFLDYVACGKVDLKVLNAVMRGIAKGCEQADCSLIGGETAEMPGLYKKGDYDLAGFTVGVVEKDKIIDGSAIREGDHVIGLASSGIHSNGYSLVRKVFSPAEQKKYAAELLKPTRIYVKPVLKVLEKFNVKGMAHITGGAFYEKLTKVLPKGKSFLIYKEAWPLPKIFQMIQKKGRISSYEMFRTFNMGIGMALVVSKKDVKPIQAVLKAEGVASFEIGQVIKGEKRKIII